MKLNYLILFPIACIGLSISPILAQNPLAQTDNFEIQKSIYQKAKSYNDPNVAITALYNMVAIQPENILLKDSLMKEYFAISQWAASYMVSREILTLEPNNLIALEISCVTLQNLGLKQQALNEYETLYLKTDRVDILYTVSYLQFELSNFNESLTNLDILINNDLTNEMSVSVSKSDDTRQDILMRSQLHYLKGLIYSEQDNNELAKISFEKSLEISPEFENAADKLKLL
jgi:tetratricopeptide (TPR) repeat protein|tara:strand:- start:6330 stop:7022 length:693 start_codon:yes stop_codon:yes gene_type:complete